jgi:hypothetical protein
VNAEDRLDAALAGDIAAYAASPEVQALVRTGDEVGGALGAWTLDPGTRARIYASALAMAGASGFANRLRAFGLDRRVQAIAGGAVVTFATATAVGVAIARGKRHPTATPAVLGA